MAEVHAPGNSNDVCMYLQLTRMREHCAWMDFRNRHTNDGNYPSNGRWKLFLSLELQFNVRGSFKHVVIALYSDNA